MALLDPLFEAFNSLFNGIDRAFNRITEPVIEDEQATDIIGDVLEDTTPADEVGAAIVDIVEEFVISDLEEAGELTPENVEAVADRTEGAAISVLTGLGLAGSAVEAASLGQIDQQQQYITQALAGLGVDEVTGLEMDARIEEGILPALNAKVAKEHRSQFVSLPDAVEALLRAKTGDEGWLQGENVDPRWANAVGSSEPVNANNLIEEWGIRDDNLEILERVSLESMEFEELIETPAELGLVVDEEVLDLVLDLAGYPEPLKDFLRQVPDEIPRSNRAWEERTAVEVLVDELEPLVADGEITPREARDLIPDEVEVAKDALEDRFRNLQTVPPGAPTRSQIESSFTRGLTDLDTFEGRLERLEIDPEKYGDIVDEAILSEIDGDLQEAFALGLISDATYGELMDRVGLDTNAQVALSSGRSISDITERRLSEVDEAINLPVSTVRSVGTSRATGLTAEGIETVGDLAVADASDVAEAAQIGEEEARSIINDAREQTEQEPLSRSRPVSEISGIGTSRVTGLRSVDITTIRDLATADVETVADAADVGEEDAQTFIDLAQSLIR